MTSLILLSLTGFLSAPAQATLTVHADQPTVAVSKDLYGIFFEEINCAGDGGIYPELVRNFSFEETDRPDHWSLAGGSSGSITMETHAKPAGFNRRYLRIDSLSAAGAENAGYWGVAVEKGKSYRLSLDVRTATWATVRVLLKGPKGDELDRRTFTVEPGNWSTKTQAMLPKRTESKAVLQVWLSGAGSVDVDAVSLFPEDTFASRSSGLRPDLVELLKGLKPAFMRFPGGCWVEGDTMATAQRWKQTIGPIAQRRTQPNLSGYQSTNGLGYHEYLQLCEDLGAAPMFVINCGMSHKEVVSMEQMGEYVQDALDAIEYANGPVSSKWGALRAQAGHPKPFNLKYLEIGNENGGAAYNDRYALIFNAVKAKYPEIVTIANVWGGTPTKAPLEVIDEHYYNAPQFFFENANRYDRYDRKGPKVYVGEYAVTQGCGNGNLIAAISEAAFMTGMERNSDIVIMSSYAPLFANLNHKAWNPDLIYFDGLKSFGTPSYHVQQMFAANRPDRIVKLDATSLPSIKEPFQPGGIGIGTWATDAEFKDIVVTSGSKTLFDSRSGRLTSELGSWETVDGVYRQTGRAQPSRAWVGGKDWKNYTVTLKAKKLGGAEGFLITVGRQDSKNDLWFNVGGWGNTEHAFERHVQGGTSALGRRVRGGVETGRWHDVKVEYSDDVVRGYLDGKLVAEAQVPVIKPLHVVAGTVDATGELVVKVVNGSSKAIASNVGLGGFGPVGSVVAQSLTSGSPMDENSLKEPNKIAPKAVKVTVDGNGLKHTFPPYSLTVIRVAPKKR